MPGTIGSVGNCAYCDRRFESGDRVWFNPKLGAICAPRPEGVCDATHNDPFRIPPSEWLRGKIGEMFDWHTVP